ncbi:putative ABC transporter permease [Clostridium beijerinckii]|uniref:putative ABC transporter permease n=1 Tax=Clostridium beijerinckii TaxID=1520 RepID=UPI003CD01B16
MTMLEKCLIGIVIILIIKFISGVILNVWLGFRIWDYSNTLESLYGPICLLYSLLCFLLILLVIYVNDYFNEEKHQDYCKVIYN